MKSKKLFFLLFCVLIIILIFLFFIIKSFNKKTNTDESASLEEYTPEEEISSEQLRKTLVNLYFPTSDNNEIKSEGKLIDSELLLQNPYKELVNLLLVGPETDTLSKIFPENTQILDAIIQNNCVTLNFSEEILKFTDDTQKYNIINCLLNTLCNLNEVNSIKIIVNNETTDIFNEEYKIH